MALTIGAGGGGATTPYGGRNGSTYGGQQFLRRPILFLPPKPTSRNGNLVRKASKKWSPRTGKLDRKNRRSSTTTTKEEEEEEQRTVQFGPDGSVGSTGAVDVSDGDDAYFLPELPGLEKNYWEGPEWDGFGFFMQYMWAFGVGFALIACGIAVATYNEGATDFKQTPAYKESIQSRDLLEEPEGSGSDVFESNPTDEAPSLE